jgi:tyrosine-protein phosphatase SIW14
VGFKGIFLRGYTAVVIVALGLGLAPAAVAQQAEIRPAIDISRVAIQNFGRINNSFFRGAQPVGRDYASLAALGVKTVINLTSDDAALDEETMVTKNGMGYLQIPMSTRVNPTKDQLVTFLSVVNDPARQPVYVHCVGGKHRTGVMTAVYRMTHDGWTAEQAFREMKQYRFGSDFLHPEFKRFVYAYHTEPAAPASPTPVLATHVAIPVTN